MPSLLSPWGPSPRQGMVLGWARGQVSRREKGLEREQDLPGPLQGSVDTHRGRQGHFLLVSHRPISEKKGGAWEPGRWTSRSPNTSCRLCRAAGTHLPQACTPICTHTQCSSHVFKQPSHMLTHPHSYAIACVPTHTHVSTISVQIPRKQTLSWQPACKGLVGRALRSNPCKESGLSRGRSQTSSFDAVTMEASANPPGSFEAGMALPRCLMVRGGEWAFGSL